MCFYCRKHLRKYLHKYLRKYLRKNLQNFYAELPNTAELQTQMAISCTSI